MFPLTVWNDRLTSMSGLCFSFCSFAGIGRAWFLWVNLFVGTGQRFLSVRGNKSIGVPPIFHDGSLTRKTTCSPMRSIAKYGTAAISACVTSQIENGKIAG